VWKTVLFRDYSEVPPVNGNNVTLSRVKLVHKINELPSSNGSHTKEQAIFPGKGMNIELGDLTNFN
jgi:hypothetical protein